MTFTWGISASPNVLLDIIIFTFEPDIFKKFFVTSCCLCIPCKS